MFQINEADLETLERELPEILNFCAFGSNEWNARKDLQESFTMIQKIVSNVRWNYGPPTDVEKIE